MRFAKFWQLWIDRANSDLGAFAKKHVIASALAVVVSAPSIPFADWFGNTMKQELLTVLFQSFIGPGFLILAAWVIAWVRAPYKLWREEKARADHLADQFKKIEEEGKPESPPRYNPAPLVYPDQLADELRAYRFQSEGERRAAMVRRILDKKPGDPIHI